MQRSTSIILLVAVLVACWYIAEAKKKGPKVTTKVFFDITIDGKDAGKVFTVFGQEVVSADNIFLQGVS